LDAWLGDIETDM